MGFPCSMIKAKKSLGQNFFINSNLAKQIVQIISEKPSDIIVEIGPGEGYFSNILDSKKKNLIMIEKDTVLASKLKHTFQKQLIVNSDFLEWEFQELEKHYGKEIVFFGSLPYNVSKKIIEKIIQSKFFNSESYFIIQKEVAEKYTDKEPNNNLLSLRTSIYANCRKLFDIKPEAFRPKPKVTSSFTLFEPKAMTSQNIILRKNKVFDRFLQDSFAQPRKMLSNNLRKYNFQQNEEIIKLLNARPQHLSLEEYVLLFSNIY